MSKLRRLLLAKHLNEINEDDIMMTADSNPEVMRCCYLAGFAKSPYFMTYKEAADVTDTAKFNAAFNNSNIVNFNEAKYFTGLIDTVGFTANKLKELSFPPNAKIHFGMKLPMCEKYNFGEYKGLFGFHNGNENILNNYVSDVTISPNNYYYKLIYGHLGKGLWVANRDGAKFWLVPRRDDVVIFPYISPNYFASVSHNHVNFKGTTMISNEYAAKNVAFINGGENLKKIVSFYNTIYEYAPYSSNIASNVPKDVEREFIVNVNDPLNFENNSTYTNYLLNPNYSNFKLKRTNFAITIYHDDLLSLFDGLHQDEYFMTLEECASLVSLENRLQNSYIERFREFKYFTGLENIEDSAFKNCIKMKDIFLPNNIKRIELNAFLNCKNLLEITLPSTLEYIGENAFAGCNMLSVIKFEGLTAPEIHPNAFGTDDNIVGKSSNCHSILLPQINSGYETILSKLTNYNQLLYLDELDLTGTITDIGIKWTDGDELLYIIYPFSTGGSLVTSIGQYGILNGFTKFAIALDRNPNYNYTNLLLERYYLVDIIQKNNIVSIDEDFNIQNGRYYSIIPSIGLEHTNTIKIGNYQLFKEYRQLDSNGMPKWWGYPYQNNIIKGIYDVVNNKNYKLKAEEIPHNKISFIESNGSALLYINTNRLIKDTDTVLLRAQLCLILTKLMGSNPVLFGWNIDSNFNSNKLCLVVLNGGGRNDTSTYIWKGFKNMTSSSNSLYNKISPQTYTFTPTDVCYNDKILPDNQHSNACYINGNSVLEPYLGTVNFGGTAENNISKYRIFEYKVIDKDNNTVLQLLPHIDDTGKACLKDEVSNELFYDENNNDYIYGEYIEKVRIIDVNNVLYTAEQYSNLLKIQELTPIGVYVKTNETEFIIAPLDANNGTTLSFGCANLNIENCSIESEQWSAISDINGYNNTLIILVASQEYTDSDGITGSPGTEACYNYIFANNERGYLPALGEWVIVQKLKDDINKCLLQIGKSFENIYYMSSTRITKSANWSLQCNIGSITSYYVNNNRPVRPFTKVIGEVVDYIPDTVIPYIESDELKALCIDTKCIITNTDIIYISFKHIKNTRKDWKAIYGWRWQGTASDRKNFNIVVDPTDTYIEINYGGNYNITNLFDDITILINPNAKQILINNILLNSGYDTSFTKPYNNENNSLYAPCIFQHNNVGTITNTPSIMRLYSYWVKDKDGNYKIHLLPHIDENGKACLKDLVSGECFYDTNGHDFKYGELII